MMDRSHPMKQFEHSTDPKIHEQAIPTLDNPQEIERTTTAFVRDFVEDARTEGVIVCLSGGIDSTVAATLAVESLHTDSVYGLVLPSDTNRKENISDAVSVANDLGIEYRVIDIQPHVDKFISSVGGDRTEVKSNPLTNQSSQIYVASTPRKNYQEALGNVAARMRMTIAYFEANTRNRLVLGTGNRTELLLGYFTKYGDGGTDLLPIGDLYKTEVRQLARHLGIPDRIVEKPPTAGLWKEQTDESELGAPYETVDAILYKVIDGEQSVSSVASELDIEPSLVRSFIDMNRRLSHKLRSPPTPSTYYD